MEIKQLTATDSSAYWEIRLEALQKNPSAFITTYQDALNKVNPVNETAERFANGNNYTYGAYLKNNLVGVVTMLRQTHPKFKHKAEILAMYVSNEIRGLGIGTKLLDKTIEQAKLVGIEQLQLGVVSTNIPAIALYKKVGFSIYGTEIRAIKMNDSYEDEELMVYFI
ncbi:GNAT family N-acetyltransferase [Aquibacillus halophilus]|uniref:GNAT family N-acetyltransferase n=1 Tax=Aquibacillus halophilus TaxID=930132 RepID=UPI001F1149F6|nr:GNAT family N-acetyltransferase [Aquibacillus halophilus]